MQEPRTRPATAAALTIGPRACFWCYGTGRVPNDYHERYDRCETWGGSGVKPDRRLAGQPALQPVAKAA